MNRGRIVTCNRRCHADSSCKVDIDHCDCEGDLHIRQPGLVIDGVAVDCPRSGNRISGNLSRKACWAHELRWVDCHIAIVAAGNHQLTAFSTSPEWPAFRSQFWQRAQFSLQFTSKSSNIDGMSILRTLRKRLRLASYVTTFTISRVDWRFAHDQTCR